MKDNNNLRMTLKSALDNLWSRISGIFGTVNGRIDDAEDRIDDIETDVSGVTSRVAGVETRMTTAEGQITGLDSRVDDIEDAMDDLEGDMIKSISLNGVNVPKDAQGNVALQETDPTVPSWAKQVKAKTSDLTNDGDGTDNNSPFATQKYVQDNGGKIDVVKVNGTALPIVSKQVDVPVPTKTSDLINDSGFSEDGVIDMEYGGEYINDLYPYLNEKIRPGEPRRFKAGILQIGILTNNQVHWDVWGYIYRYDDGDDIEYTMICYDEYSTYACYYARVYSNEQDWRRDIVHVLRVFQFAEAGGGGSGAIDTVTFNGITHQPDASGDVSLTETDPTVPSWAKQSSKPTYTAQEVGALPNTTPIPSKTSDLTNDSGFLTSSTGVSGVKGNAETGGYRHGNVIITPANIGAVAKSGDTMTGPLKWASATALPAASSLQYFLGIDAFADGGTTHYITAANLLAAIGAMPIHPASIEFYPSSSARHGGYIDFHYNGSTSDYTVRLMESAEGVLAIKTLSENNYYPVLTTKNGIAKGKFTSTKLYTGTPAVGATFSLSDYIYNYNVLRIVDTTHYNNDVFMPVHTNNQVIMANGSTSFPDGTTPRFIIWEFTATTSDGKNYTVARKAQMNITTAGVQYGTLSGTFGIEIYGLK